MRADNTLMAVATGVFTADNTYLRTPIWITPSNLGFRRAHNYLTLLFQVADLNTTFAEILLTLLPTNPDDGSPSILPPGLTLDGYTGEIAGRVPYQTAVTESYKFTLRAQRYTVDQTEENYKDKTFTINLLGEVDSFINWVTPADLGFLPPNYNSTLSLVAKTTVPKSIMLYQLIDGKLPPGLSLNIDGEITGKVANFSLEKDTGIFAFKESNGSITTFDQNTTTFDRIFTFTVKARDHFGYSGIEQEFTITVSPPQSKNFSNIFAIPFLKPTDKLIWLDIINNKKYFPKEFLYREQDPNFGIQKTMQMLIYAGIETFTAELYISKLNTNTIRKRYKLGDIKTAIAKEPGTQNVVYEIVYLDVIDPGQLSTESDTRKNFITKKRDLLTVDSTMFDLDPDSVENPKPYALEIVTNKNGSVTHYLDPYFLISSRSGKKLFIDITPLKIGNKNTGSQLVGAIEPFRFRPKSENTIKTDFSEMTIDGAGTVIRHISNINNIRDNIQSLGETEINYTPLWMRSGQINSIIPLGYQTAIPICYCKPGASKEIYTALKTDNIIFNGINFEIDRFIIDSIEGKLKEHYLLFHNYSYNI